MRIHVYDVGGKGAVNVIENVASYEEHSTFYVVHVKGEKWFDQILIDKHDFDVYVEQ